ncbi:MAG: hypothetical protein NT106_07345 [Candidatus Sumerlaeota bacterium]|nr:hypothetical protein [Candidatus Sumerlaeota bacterium]
MNLSRREKMLGGAILFILLGWLIGRYAVYEIYKVLAVRTDNLNTARKTYEDCAEKMKKKEEIISAYREVVGGEKISGSAKKDTDQTKEFSEFVFDLSRRIGFIYPIIDPSKTEPIMGVNDYSFITLAVNTNGDLSNVSKLLKGFDREAVLIRDLDVRSRLDNPNLDVTINVARLVQVGMKTMVKKGGVPQGSAAGPSTFVSHTARKPVVTGEK